MQFRILKLLLFLDSWFLEFSASFDCKVVVFSWEIIESSKSQIDPFSPILKATDLGSIQSVNSCGRVRSLLGKPHALAASAITGSREWLILMQRKPLPNKGFWGCQWCLYLAHKISFIFLWKASSCFSDILPFPLNILVTNLHAISTSAFIFLSGSIFRTWLFIVDVLVIVRNWNEFKASLSVKFSFIYCFTQIDYQSPPNGDFSLKNMGKVILYSFSPSRLFSPKNLRK